jgi:hypothetical protein
MKCVKVTHEGLVLFMVSHVSPRALPTGFPLNLLIFCLYQRLSGQFDFVLVNHNKVNVMKLRPVIQNMSRLCVLSGVFHLNPITLSWSKIVRSCVSSEHSP